MGARSVVLLGIAVALACGRPNAQPHAFGAGPQPPNPNPATTQTAWCVDRNNTSTCASDTANDGASCSCGTSGHGPMRSVAGIRSRLTQGTPNSRPQFPPGTILVLQGSAPTVALSGTIATASAWSRTSANGQIKITDGSVSDFHPFVPALFHDKTNGAIGWMYEPQTANAQGIVSVGRQPQTAGTIVSVAARTAISASDQYELLTETPVYFGTTSLTRDLGGVSASPITVTITWLSGASSQPDLADPLSAILDSDGIARVAIYRLHDTAHGGDVWNPQTNGGVTYFTGARVETQECLIDQQTTYNQGIVRHFNSGFTGQGNPAGLVNINGPVKVYYEGGFSYTFLLDVYGGGAILIDQDFLIDYSSGALYVDVNAHAFVGNFAVWGGGQAPIVQLGGALQLQTLSEGAHVVYGAAGSNPVISMATGGAGCGQISYSGCGAAATTFQFNTSTFSMPVLGTSSFGVNPSTGALVGPTTNTFAHLDAALSAGTGFGGGAFDPIGCAAIHCY